MDPKEKGPGKGAEIIEKSSDSDPDHPDVEKIVGEVGDHLLEETCS